MLHWQSTAERPWKISNVVGGVFPGAPHSEPRSSAVLHRFHYKVQVDRFESREKHQRTHRAVAGIALVAVARRASSQDQRERLLPSRSSHPLQDAQYTSLQFVVP